jgi:hypothetical protein
VYRTLAECEAERLDPSPDAFLPARLLVQSDINSYINKLIHAVTLVQTWTFKFSRVYNAPNTAHYFSFNLIQYVTQLELEIHRAKIITVMGTPEGCFV